MEDKDKQIETIKQQIESANDSWMRYFKENEKIKAELTLYKNLCKAQSEVINSK